MPVNDGQGIFMSELIVAPLKGFRAEGDGGIADVAARLEVVDLSKTGDIEVAFTATTLIDKPRNWCPP
jgi:hypothetical protein